MPIGRVADEVRRIGRSAGLDAIGICDARPFDGTKRALLERKALGWSAGMQFTYRNPDRSTDPQATLPGAAAIVVGARGYNRRAHGGPDPDGPRMGGLGHLPDGPDGRQRRPQGRVAMYSWVDHYRPLRLALATVAEYLTEAGWRARVLADDNALVDRAAAVRAGIGWYGKNTNVLLPDAGSWFVLGSVVTDAPIASGLPVVAPVIDGCGPCRRCLPACPTGALVEAGKLDARRCLAWLLQASGVFPHEYREALGNRLYGCDDCQTACPANQLVARRDPPPDAEPGAQVVVDVLDLLADDDEQLMARVGRWYIPGREPRYVRRNALIVLGNSGDASAPGVMAALREALADRDPIVRSHAVWAAARLGRRDLLGALEHDLDALVVAEMSVARDIAPRGSTAGRARP